MSNLIEIDFTLCEDAPVNGYRVRYQPQAGGPLLTWPVRFFATPAVFDDGGAEPDGTLYQGFLDADCGPAGFGPAVAWATPEESASTSVSASASASTSESASASASASVPPCAAVTIEPASLPDGEVGVPYTATLLLDGDGPFTLGATVKPAWMTIAVVGATVELSGTPDTVDAEVSVDVQVFNCDGAHFDLFLDAITIVEGSTSVPPCEAVEFVESSLPDGTQGVFYSVDLHLTGDPPFNLDGSVKPSWMTVTLVGDVVELRGTPDVAGTDITVSVQASNCDGNATALFSDTIDVAAGAPAIGTVSMDSCQDIAASVNSVKWNGLDVSVDTGAFPVGPGSSITVAAAGTGTHTLLVNITTATAGRVVVTDSAGNVSCQNLSVGTVTYTFPGFVITNGFDWTVAVDCSTC